MSLGTLAELDFDAVIFDLDGTLIDSTPAVIRSWQRWAEEHRVDPELLLQHHGVPSASLVRTVLPEDRHASGIERIAELELADTADIVLLPGARQALADPASAKNGIATSCTVPLAEARLTAARLTPPTVLVTADDVERGKPAPDAYLEAAARLQVDPARCLVVEDAPAGLTAAREAGCRTLAVVTTTAETELEADAIVPDLSAVRFRVGPDGRVRVEGSDDPNDP